LKGIGIIIEIKVSVITPFFNGLPYLEECVNSVLAQTLPEIEVILIDDGSTDGSGELADSFAKKDSRVRILHQTNKGVSSARNAGLAIAQGDYIGFVDADDYIEPEMYEKMFSAASEKAAQVACTWFKCVYDSENNAPDKKFLFESPTLLTPDDVKKFLPGMNTNQIFHFTWRNIFNRSFLENERLKFNENIIVGEDTLFNMQALLASAKVLMLPGTLYFYRIHKESCMGSKRYKPLLLSSLSLQYEEKLKLYNKYFSGNTLELLQNTAEYTLKMHLPLLLKNVYTDIPHSQKALKQIFVSKLVSDAHKYYDINHFRSKSLDWLMLWFAKHKMYLPAHLICKYILYKS